MNFLLPLICRSCRAVFSFSIRTSRWGLNMWLLMHNLMEMGIAFNNSGPVVHRNGNVDRLKFKYRCDKAITLPSFCTQMQQWKQFCLCSWKPQVVRNPAQWHPKKIRISRSLLRQKIEKKMKVLPKPESLKTSNCTETLSPVNKWTFDPSKHAELQHAAVELWKNLLGRYPLFCNYRFLNKWKMIEKFGDLV